MKRHKLSFNKWKKELSSLPDKPGKVNVDGVKIDLSYPRAGWCEARLVQNKNLFLDPIPWEYGGDAEEAIENCLEHIQETDKRLLYNPDSNFGDVLVYSEQNHDRQRFAPAVFDMLTGETYIHVAGKSLKVVTSTCDIHVTALSKGITITRKFHTPDEIVSVAIEEALGCWKKLKGKVRLVR